MDVLRNLIAAFFRGIARSRTSLVGALLTTATSPFLLGLIIADAVLNIKNPYVSGFVYLVLGPLFIIGLIMVFIGLFFLKGKEEVGLFTFDYLRHYFTDPSKFNRIRELLFLGIFLTGVNIFIIGLLSYQGYQYMESNAFCGRVCHQVMKPEYTAYQFSPHSRVNCVECHIGPGATWFVKSKLSGVRQIFATVLDTYSRPIETPVYGLRPARETCEECHQPDKFHGDKLYVRDTFQPDRENTHLKTVILVKIGSAGSRVRSPRGIHWHVAPENRIIYEHTDYQRFHIPVVTLVKPDGTKTVYRTDEEAAEKPLPPEGGLREMDCVDCHNRPTHIFQSPGEALDEQLLNGDIPQELPFIKQQGLAAISRSYRSQQEAVAGIESQLTGWYRKNFPDLAAKQPEMLAKAVAGTQAAYLHNVFPSMNVNWNTYVNLIGHGPDFDIGCFRCHDGEHVSEAGETIPSDCDTCHVILAEDEAKPEILEQLESE